MSKHANVSIFVAHIGCPNMCSFCNQHTISGSLSLPHAKDVMQACEKALESGLDMSNTEIAFFGGSFTAIERSYMIELLSAAKPYVDMGFKGIRISTRPDCIGHGILSILKEYGVTSIELGAQSMNDTVLSLNDRGHTAEDVIAASKLVKQYGFTLGLQMMVGLYGSTPELDKASAREIIALRPHEVRIYPVVILNNTKLGDLYKMGIYKPYTLENTVEICAELLDMFEQNGIKVIKLGLHASEIVEADMLGGLYHPALRELCEAERFKRLMSKMIGNDKAVTFTVRPNDLSKALGQKRSNIAYFNSLGIEVSIKTDKNQTEKLVKI